MQREPIASSSIASVGYDEATKTLELEFHNGRIYQFFNIPPQMAAALKAAPSHGAYFNKYLRKSEYEFTLIRDA